VTPGAAVRLAWGLWGLALALIASALAVNAVHAWSYSGVLAVLSLAFLTVGRSWPVAGPPTRSAGCCSAGAW
jgi:hypothetical protein